MSSEPITVVSIDTKPSHDPYVNIEGVVSKTYLKLDPRNRTVWVTQEYQTGSTSMDEWNGLVLSWGVNSYPSEADMRKWIDSSMGQLQTICDGYKVVWNGHNHVGRLSKDAHDTTKAIEYELDNDGGPANYYEWYTAESWLEHSLDKITADTTDEELAEMAKEWEPDDQYTILGNILAYATEHRDELKRVREFEEQD